VLRADLSGNPTFVELMERVRETVEEGLAHQDLHFRQVVEALPLKRDRSRPTLCGINFIYQRDFIKPRQFAGLRLTSVPSKSPGAIYDLNFFVVERPDGWRLSCEYNYDLYRAERVNVMLGQLRCLFEQIAADPARRISQFSFPERAAEPLPAFVPGTVPRAAETLKSGLHNLAASHSPQE
jgi:non-ribosomal peptide synthetase component F